MVQFHREGKLTPAQQAFMAPRLPGHELYDLESERSALFHWIDKTNDQGRVPESPEVFEFWVRDAGQRWGTPEWRR